MHRENSSYICYYRFILMHILGIIIYITITDRGMIMRFDQFDFLVEISKHKSMNAASKTLHVSPQALSISI